MLGIPCILGIQKKLAIYNELYDQIKKHIASAADSSQYLLLLDYVIRQLRSM